VIVRDSSDASASTRRSLPHETVTRGFAPARGEIPPDWTVLLSRRPARSPRAVPRATPVDDPAHRRLSASAASPGQTTVSTPSGRGRLSSRSSISGRWVGVHPAPTKDFRKRCRGWCTRANVQNLQARSAHLGYSPRRKARFRVRPITSGSSKGMIPSRGAGRKVRDRPSPITCRFPEDHGPREVSAAGSRRSPARLLRPSCCRRRASSRGRAFVDISRQPAGSMEKG
jgi:hypothetical protein